MKLWIICSGEPAIPRKKSYDAAELAALRQALLEGQIAPYTGRAAHVEGWRLYVSPHAAARQTAKALYPELEAREEPRLRELEVPASGGKKPLWLWRMLLRPSREDTERIESLIGELEEAEGDAILITHPLLIPLLLDRLRIHGHCINRGDFGAVKPLERILITRRDMHCGGCSHNCFLSNPGCGIGRDKAARLKISGK